MKYTCLVLLTLLLTACSSTWLASTPTASLSATPTATATPEAPRTMADRVNEMEQIAQIGKGSITAMDWSPDGASMALANYNGIYFYDIATLQETRSIETPVWFNPLGIMVGIPYRTIDYHPNGRYLASASQDNNVLIWNVQDGSLVRTLEGHTDDVVGVAYSPDGQFLASTSLDRTVRLWDADDGNLLYVLEGNNQPADNIVFHPDGSILAAYEFGRVWLWNTSDGSLNSVLEINRGYGGMDFSPDGSMLVVGSDDGFHLWDWKNNILLNSHGGDAILRLVDVSPSGDLVATEAGVYRRNDLRYIFDTGGKIVAFSPDGQTLAIVFPDSILLRDVSGDPERDRKIEGFGSNTHELLFSPGGDILAYRSDPNLRPNHMIQLWNMLLNTSMDISFVIDGFTGDHAFAFSPSRKDIIYPVMFESGSQTYIQMSEVQTGDWVALFPFESDIQGDSFQKNVNQIMDVAFSPSGERFAAGMLDHSIYLFNAEELILIGVLKEPRSPISSLAFNPAGTLLASSSWDGSVRIWQTSSGKLLHELTADEAYPDCLDNQIDSWCAININPVGIKIAFHPDGTGLASGSDDGKVRLWNVADGTLLYEVNTGSAISSLAFSPDGSILVGTSNDIIHVWNAANGELLHELEDSTSLFSISPDGSLLAATSQNDPSIKLWSLPSGELLKTLVGHAGYISSLAFQPGGRLLASAASDGTIRFWGWEDSLTPPTPQVTLTATPVPWPTLSSPLSQQATITEERSTFRFSLDPMVTEWEADTNTNPSAVFHWEVKFPYQDKEYSVAMARYQSGSWCGVVNDTEQKVAEEYQTYLTCSITEEEVLLELVNPDLVGDLFLSQPATLQFEFSVSDTYSLTLLSSESVPVVYP